MINQPSANRLEFFSEELQFRDMEFDELLASFRQVLVHPGESIARVILMGPAGSGKSFILQKFQEQINNSNIGNPENRITLKCLTVDCSKYDRSKQVVYDIIKQIDPYFKANLDECYTAELQYILADILYEREEALIIIFDNIDTLVAYEPDEVNSLIYGFQRFSEGKMGEDPNLFSQILVAQDLEFLHQLDQAVFRRVVSDVIPFEPYSAEQTFLLLKEKIRRTIRKKITEETIWFIAMISQGNMRLAMELLEKGNALALKQHQLSIQPEDIRKVNEKITDFKITRQAITELPAGEKLLLLTVARRFLNNSRAFINFLDLPGLFFSICEEYDTLHTAKYFSEILNSLETMAIISIHNIEKDVIVTLADISATKLHGYLEKEFKQKRRDTPYFI